MLGHETLDNTDCVVEGYLFLEVRTMNHIINKRDLLLKKSDSVNLTINDKLVDYISKKVVVFMLIYV